MSNATKPTLPSAQFATYSGPAVTVDTTHPLVLRIEDWGIPQIMVRNESDRLALAKELRRAHVQRAPGRITVAR